ncbi:MAG TPA: hypothetical protein VFZ26_05625 [Gemmatimonadales bacterium]
MTPVIEGELELTTPAGTVRIEGEQRDLVVMVPDARTGIELLGTLNSALGGRRAVEAVDGFLRASGVGLRVRVRGAEVAHLGAGAKPGLVSRLVKAAVLR